MKFRQKNGSTWGAWQEISIKALDGMPIGSIILFAGTDIPTGWMVCEGATLNEEEYPELYDVIGHTYGGSGLDFMLPNFKGRVPVGINIQDTDFDTLGETGGSKELQAHTHTLNSMVGYAEAGGQTKYTTGYGSARVNTGITSDVAGSGTSGNLQPYLVVNYIIKVSNTTPTMASINDAYSTSTTDGYSCNYVNDELDTLDDKITALATKNSNRTVYYSDSQQVINQANGSPQMIWGMERTITTTGKPLLVSFTINCIIANGGSPNLSIRVDGVQKEQFVISHPKDIEHVVSYTIVLNDISAGTHSVQLWADKGNAPSITVVSYESKSLQVAEL